MPTPRYKPPLKYRLIFLALALSGFALPLLVAYGLVLNNLQRSQREEALNLASAVLHKSEQIATLIASTNQALAGADSPDPCASNNILLMRELSVRAGVFVALGYVKDDFLECSSFGYHGKSIPLGEPAFETSADYRARPNVALPFAPRMRFFVTTNIANGYAAIVDPALPLSVVGVDQQSLPVGLLDLKSHKVLLRSHDFDTRWAYRIGTSALGSRPDGEGKLIAYARSVKYGYAAYVVMPSTKGWETAWRAFALFVPICLGFGLLCYLLLRIRHKNAGTLRERVRRAIRKRRMFLHYQPIVDLHTGHWVGAEALLRWRTTSGEMIGPAVFIPVAEQAGLVRRLSDLVIENWVRDCRLLFQAYPEFYVNINLMPDDLRRRDLGEAILAALDRSDAKPRNLHVEITENQIVDIDSARASLASLRKLGVAVAIDDFGTGYSSLSNLANLPVDCLKIDKSFVDSIGTDKVTSSVVGHIIELGKSLNLNLVAEGVESEEQAAYLRAHGVRYAQGWLFSRALPLADLRVALDRQHRRHAIADGLPTTG